MNVCAGHSTEKLGRWVVTWPKILLRRNWKVLWTSTEPAEIIPIAVYFQYWPICAGDRYTAVHNTHMYCSYVVVNTYNGLRLRLWGGPFCRLFERMRVSTHTQKVAKAKSARSMLCCTHKFSEGLSGLRHNESQRAMFLYVNTMRVFCCSLICVSAILRL